MMQYSIYFVIVICSQQCCVRLYLTTEPSSMSSILTEHSDHCLTCFMEGKAVRTCHIYYTNYKSCECVPCPFDCQYDVYMYLHLHNPRSFSTCPSPTDPPTHNPPAHPNVSLVYMYTWCIVHMFHIFQATLVHYHLTSAQSNIVSQSCLLHNTNCNCV